MVHRFQILKSIKKMKYDSFQKYDGKTYISRILTFAIPHMGFIKPNINRANRAIQIFAEKPNIILISAIDKHPIHITGLRPILSAVCPQSTEVRSLRDEREIVSFV